MTASNEILLKHLPATLPMLLQAALPGKARPGKGQAPVFPQRSLEVTNFRCERKQLTQLKRYHEVCRFNGDSDRLPLTYLHIHAFRLQLKLMLADDFPLAPMGCIHLRNSITQYRDISASETISLRCRLGEHAVTEKGIEFSFIGTALIDGERVWEGNSHYLSRHKARSSDTRKSLPLAEQNDNREKHTIAYEHRQMIDISRSDARRYARVSGDFNPIHLLDVSAKLLGFRSMIIHGMWSKAACLALLQEHIVTPKFSCSVDFKSPIFLPAKVQLLHRTTDQGLQFELRSEEGSRPHLLGAIHFL